MNIVMSKETTPILNDPYSQVITISNNEEKIMKRKKVCKNIMLISFWSFVAIIIISICIIIAVFIHNKKSHNDSNNSINSINLNLEDLTNNWEQSTSWNIIKYIYGKDQVKFINTKGYENSIKVEYPIGSYSPSAGEINGFGGFDFYSQPRVLPDTTICFKFNVNFAANFNWAKGGKLPGFWIGDMGASGGNHDINGYSFRIAWKANGIGEVYLYIPQNQNQDYYNQEGYVSNDIYGDSLWRGVFQFYKNRWNSIIISSSLNTFQGGIAMNDGKLNLTINNITKFFNQLKWTEDPSHKINGIMMDTFFGGSDVSWATPVTKWSYFRNFNLSKTC